MLICTLSFILGGFFTAYAAPLFVANHSFEDFVLSNGKWTHILGEPHASASAVPSADPIPFWTVTAKAGTWNNTVAQLPGGTTDGENTAWLHGTSISQNLSDVLMVNTTYELNIDVGFTIGGGSPGYKTSLVAGGVVIAEDNNSLSLPYGSLMTSSITYTALPGDPHLGGTLGIVIESFGIETIFDNVHLDANSSASVPEPSTLLLFGSGLVGLGFLRRRFKV